MPRTCLESSLCFQHAFGMKFNFNKSKVFGVGVSTVELESIASITGFLASQFPCTLFDFQLVLKCLGGLYDNSNLKANSYPWYHIMKLKDALAILEFNLSSLFIKKIWNPNDTTSGYSDIVSLIVNYGPLGLDNPLGLNFHRAWCRSIQSINNVEEHNNMVSTLTILHLYATEDIRFAL
ncbi:hypothetical protein Tco_1299505 [Tanacetum coccineum]